MDERVAAVEAALAIAPEATGQSLDYSRGNTWGYACHYETPDHGLTLTGYLFAGTKKPHPGDWLILPNGSGTTRYRITSAKWMRDPDDMWKFAAVFDPRRNDG